MAWVAGGTIRFAAGGAELECRAFGPPPGEAPTIVMLHEGLGSLGLWKDFPEAVQAETGCGVFAYSREGYGHSDPTPLPRPLDYMEREARDVLPEVLSAIGFQSGVLLGHSDGASIAALYAGGVQDIRVRGLILMAPHFFTEPMGLEAIAKAKAAYETGDLRDRLARHHADPDNAFRGWCDAWLDPGFADWNIADCIDYLRVPVLAIQGADDEYGTVAQVEEIENRIYSPVDVELFDGCGHAPHVERREETLKAVADFMARLIRIETEVVEPSA